MRFRGLPLLILLLVAQSVPASEVKLEKDGQGCRLLVDGAPYFVRGVDYRVTRIGQSPDDGSLRDWATYDDNGDGRNDPAYEAWVDADGDGRRGADEPIVGDFELMRRMGVNTIRWYMNDFKGQTADKALLRDLYARFGIRVAVGNKFGAYTIDSGASWEAGTDYLDPEQRRRLLDSVRRMAMEHKDEPYTLLWLLGNENNLPFTNTNAARYPEAYAMLLEEAAKLLHELDGKHPVAVVNGDTKGIAVFRKLCPSVDIFGVNAYRGPKGFGGMWREVDKQLGKPVLVTEYGGSFANGLDEEAQADYHRGCWKDIEANGFGRGAGNALGGFAFEWLDEWWKAGDPKLHAEKGTSGRQGTGGASWTQEYCGILTQGEGQDSPVLRRPRKVYEVYRRAWTGGQG